MKKVKRPTVSLCMIVKDEEKFLSKCLQSVKEMVDEIIIVDTGSSDATLEIARSFEAKVFQHKWKDSFSDARNVSLKYATSDWILFLDADEVLDEKSAGKIRDVLPRTKHFGFFFCIYNMKDNGSVSGRHYTVRLFRNQKGVRFAGIIHEQIIPMGTLTYSGMSIYHSGYDLDPETMKRKNERNACILKEALAKNGKDSVLRYHLANIHLLLGEYDEAIEHATKGMKLTEGAKEKNSLYLTTLQVLSQVYYHLGKWEKAEACCLEALEVRDDFIDALFTLARIYRSKGDHRKTILACHRFLEKKKLIDCKPENGFFFRCLTSWGREAEVHNDLGGIFYENGNPDRAIEEVKKAIALMPHNARAYYNLGSALVEKGHYKEAEESFRKALAIKPAYLEAEEGLRKIEGVS
jgi:glycosyltransferase involved in cell wall biosynthesis